MKYNILILEYSKWIWYSKICVHKIFFISNLGFCLKLGLLNFENEIGTGVA